MSQRHGEATERSEAKKIYNYNLIYKKDFGGSVESQSEKARL